MMETVAQMLRRWDDDDVRMPCSICKELNGMDICKNDACPTSWVILADRIEAEQAEALENAHAASLLSLFDAEIANQGWPERNCDEHIADYINRFFLPRPLFKDGQPIKWGDKAGDYEGTLESIEWRDDGTYYLTFKVRDGYEDGDRFDSDERLQRPAPPDVVDTDGKPIAAKEGE